jgi:hypothetical protein
MTDGQSGACDCELHIVIGRSDRYQTIYVQCECTGNLLRTIQCRLCQVRSYTYVRHLTMHLNLLEICVRLPPYNTVPLLYNLRASAAGARPHTVRGAHWRHRARPQCHLTPGQARRAGKGCRRPSAQPSWCSTSPRVMATRVPTRTSLDVGRRPMCPHCPSSNLSAGTDGPSPRAPPRAAAPPRTNTPPPIPNDASRSLAGAPDQQSASRSRCSADWMRM